MEAERSFYPDDLSVYISVVSSSCLMLHASDGAGGSEMKFICGATSFVAHRILAFNDMPSRYKDGSKQRTQHRSFYTLEKVIFTICLSCKVTIISFILYSCLHHIVRISWCCAVVAGLSKITGRRTPIVSRHHRESEFSFISGINCTLRLTFESVSKTISYPSRCCSYIIRPVGSISAI